jgi:hypothetical protein
MLADLSLHRNTYKIRIYKIKIVLGTDVCLSWFCGDFPQSFLISSIGW